MEDLPADLTVDILSRLPVKTIVQCKRVCKKWRNLVSDSSFINLHLSRSPTALIFHHNPRTTNNRNVPNDLGILKWLDWRNLVSDSSFANLKHTGSPSTGLILRDNPRTTNNRNVSNDQGILKWVEIEDKADHHYLHHERFMSVDLFDLAPILQKTQLRLMGSVNGLICLWQYSRELNLDHTYICNPVTREYMILPKKRYRRDGFVITIYGFGVSSLMGKYKVVWILQGEIKPGGNKPSRPKVLEAEVYTLGTGQWRSLGRIPYWLNGFNENYGLFLNNRCHWIICDEKDVFGKICTFDFDKEKFQLFPSPPCESVQENRFHYQSLAVSKGCLCKVDTYDSEMAIWVTKEYGIKKSWHKDVVITQEICVDLGWPVFGPIHLIKGLKDGSILMVFEGKLCMFDPRSETIEDTKMFGRDLCGMAYCPSFLKLQNFESERVRCFKFFTIFCIKQNNFYDFVMLLLLSDLLN